MSLLCRIDLKKPRKELISCAKLWSPQPDPSVNQEGTEEPFEENLCRGVEACIDNGNQFHGEDNIQEEASLSS